MAYQVGQFCHLLGISRTTFYELLKSGKIKAMKLGGRTLIPRAEAERLARGEVR
ncbi:MAG: helix-turn-helix domain-containing protein [Hyphomicrobiales bacterium]|nr:helix-turn-helix domain-containing protein [Hyphomicrobiales bacterium]